MPRGKIVLLRRYTVDDEPGENSGICVNWTDKSIYIGSDNTMSAVQRMRKLKQ